jgi:hypothetical protein
MTIRLDHTIVPAKVLSEQTGGASASGGKRIQQFSGLSPLTPVLMDELGQ